MITDGEIVELLQALIRNACVNDGSPDSGHEERSVATLAGYVGAPDMVFEPRPGRVSAFYEIPAVDPTAPKLLLMGHLDVVPVNESGWDHDPFAGDVIDGFVWGRGAVDMLNQTSAMAAVFKRFRDGRLPAPAGGLVFLAVADEEAGGKWGAHFLTREHWDTVGCDYLITEIAYPSIDTPGGPAYPVSVGEKGPYWRRLSTRGVPGHASQPYGTANALLPLAEAFTAIAQAPTPVKITAEWRGFVDGLGLADAQARALTDPDLVDAAIEQLAAERPGFARYVHACTHLTVAPTVLHGGSKTNTIPDAARGEIDVRVLPGQDAGTVDGHLRKSAGPGFDRLEVEPIADFPATASQPSGPLWEAIQRAVESVTGSSRVLPTLMPATTDARFFRARGTSAYGVGLFDDRVQFEDFLGMFHGNNERVSVASLGLTAELLVRIVQGVEAVPAG
jgi:acetylornithine deacetylase/succinyl-diaminopimelate desuccinylase-like protein